MWIAIKTFQLQYNEWVLKYTFEEVYIIKKKCIELQGTNSNTDSAVSTFSQSSHMELVN